MPSLEKLPEKGTYILLIFVTDVLKVSVGELGVKIFWPGYYTYTGSALGKGASSLLNRLARHLKTAKKKHWHIDFLLPNTHVNIEAIIVISSNRKLECEVNQLLREKIKAKVTIPKFGASDCQKKCGSHLLFFPEMTKRDILVQKIVKHLRSLRKRLIVYIIR
jgi:Uri superfamily endonuclease